MSKPKFNPNAPFKEVKPKFDPTASFEEVKSDKPSVGESVARGATKGLTLGFADELSGLLGAGLDVLSGNNDGGIQGAIDSYRDYRDAYRKGDKASEAANPATAFASEVAGGLLVPGGTLKGLSTWQKILRTGAMGALQGVGQSEGANVAGDAGTGAALGLLGLGAGNLISRAIPTAEGSRALARSQAIKHLRPTPKIADKLGPEKLNEIADTALESGALKFGSRAGNTAERLELLREKAGKEIGNILDSSKASADPYDVFKKIHKEVIDPLRGVSKFKGLIADLEAQADDFLAEHVPGFAQGKGLPQNIAPISAKALEKEKRAVQDTVNYLTDHKAKMASQSGVANAFAKATEEAIDKESPKLGEAFKSAKKRFGNLAAAEAMSGRTGALTNSGTGLAGTLYDLGFGQEALRQLAQGNLGGAGLIGAARGLTKGRMASSIAAPAFAIAQALERNGKTNEALKIIEELVQASAPVVGRQSAESRR